MGQPTEFDTILRQYFPEHVWHVQTGPSGMNNTTRYIGVDHDRFVLRVYETHRDEDKVAYEHLVLSELRKTMANKEGQTWDGLVTMPVPHPVNALDGPSFVRSPEGKLAALFHYREGCNPVLENAEDFHGFGRAAGMLSCMLKELHLKHEPVYRACYELSYPSVAEIRETIIEPCRKVDSGMADLAADLELVAQDLEELHSRLPEITKLPHQLIHGDLNASNVLAGADNRLCAFLDFEFVAWDLRLMELAVGLSEAMPEEELTERDWVNMASMARGFSEFVRLTKEEAHLLPILVQLRKVDVFIHFLNRWRNGVDSLENARMFLKMAGVQHRWIKRNGERLAALVPDVMK